jgi:hypothetical protein
MKRGGGLINMLHVTLNYFWLKCLLPSSPKSMNTLAQTTTQMRRVSPFNSRSSQTSVQGLKKTRTCLTNRLECAEEVQVILHTTQLSVGEGTSNQESKLTSRSLIISEISKMFSEFPSS